MPNYLRTSLLPMTGSPRKLKDLFTTSGQTVLAVLLAHPTHQVQQLYVPYEMYQLPLLHLLAR